MLIIGAKGFAKEVIEIFFQLGKTEKLFLFDDISNDLPAMIYNQFKIIRETNEVVELFKQDNSFVLGLGGPINRLRLTQKFISLGGELTSIISPLAQVGHFGTYIDKGSNIMTGTIITNDVIISKGCLINIDCTIGHDSII